MKTKIACTLFSSILVTGFASANGLFSRIVGGVESDFSKHSYVVSLQENGSHYCGGSLIAAKFVLSAGHCADGFNATDVRIVIGSKTHSATTAGAELHKIVKITINPDFVNTGDEISHDWSLWELDTPSAFAPIAMTEALADPAKVSVDGNALTLGWGTTSESGSLSKTLREVVVPLVTPADCSAAYPGQIDETQICAGLKQGGKDSCQGDSGGPLLVNDKNGKEILVGAVSWGEGCARPDKYGVYSDVGQARDWIDSVISVTPSVMDL